MQRPYALSIAMTAAALCTAPAATQNPRTVVEVMTTTVVPASDVIFSAAAEPPTTDDGWAEVRRNAAILVEAGKILLTRRGDRDEGWDVAVTALISEAQTGQRAAAAKDDVALRLASNDIYLTCETCHERFWENR